MNLTLAQLKERFPHASQSFINANLKADDQRVCAVHQKPHERAALDSLSEGKEACWHDANGSFEIVFAIYTTNPADWDNWDCKYLQDWICKAGLLPGDGWKTLTGRVYSRKVPTKAEEKTVVTLTALGAQIQ